MTRVALIGLGEVGRTFAEDLRAVGIDLAAWDTAFPDPASPASRNALTLDLTPSGSARDAVTGADLVVSARPRPNAWLPPSPWHLRWRRAPGSST